MNFSPVLNSIIHPHPLPCLRPARRDFAQAGARGEGIYFFKTIVKSLLSPLSFEPPAFSFEPSALSFLVVAFFLDVVFGEIHAPFAENLRNRPFAALDAIRDPYTPVTASGKGQAGNLSTVVLDQRDTFKVSERVLRHAAVPPEDAREERLCTGVEAKGAPDL